MNIYIHSIIEWRGGLNKKKADIPVIQIHMHENCVIKKKTKHNMANYYNSFEYKT
jgi:predicted esterase